MYKYIYVLLVKMLRFEEINKKGSQSTWLSSHSSAVTVPMIRVSHKQPLIPLC